MMSTTQELIQEVISLPVEERAFVIDSVLRSLNPPDDDLDQQWITVVKRRLAEIRSGSVTPRPDLVKGVMG